MSEPAKRKATYDDLYNIPKNMIGEIIDGELVVHPRPPRKHIYASLVLDGKINPPCQFGSGGPGGWIILIDLEIQLGEHTIVTDLAGWKRERFPVEEETNSISVLLIGSAKFFSVHLPARQSKKDAADTDHGVGHLWLMDPVAMSLDVFRLESGRLGCFAENDKVRAEPFHEVEINL